jgi:hypothetical protein
MALGKHGGLIRESLVLTGVLADRLQPTSRARLRPAPGSALSRLVATKKVVHVPDITADQAYIDRNPMFGRRTWWLSR